MDIFRATIKFLTVASLAFAAVQIYLTLNKLWKRKHEPLVAESISIMGESIGLVPLFFLSVNFMLEGQWEGVVDGGMWMLAGMVSVVIGSGMWVEGKRGRSFWSLIKEAIQLERGEVGELAKALFGPSGAPQILTILGQVALIDDHLDDRERRYIQSFADAWGIRFSWEDLLEGHVAGHLNYIQLRQSVADYLSTSPPNAQVSQLGDVIHALVKADDEVTKEEELVLAELEGMFDHYLEMGKDIPVYGVAIVPQDPAQDEAIRALLPDVEKREIEGGQAYVVGRYFSETYADIVGEQYRVLNFFTTVVRA